MNPATASAVGSAIDILLQSIHAENKNVLEAMSPGLIRTLSYREDNKIHTGTLTHVDDYASALKVTLEAVQRHLLDKISALHTEHNRMISLHQLPIEILIQIITGVLEPFQSRHRSGQTHLGRLVTLCQVCRRWRDVINSTPSFWATIDILDPPAVTSTAILRSANHHLNVIGAPSYGGVRYASRPPDRCAEFSNAAMMHSTRWRSIELVAASTEEALAIMNAPAPLLQSLEVKSMAPTQLPSQNGARGNMFHNTNPRLRRLGLHGVAIPWDSYILRDLRYLSISRMDHFAPSCEETLGILRACPGLVEVSLSLKLTAAVETPKKEPSFTLADLVSMSFILSPSSALALLETVHTPSVQSVAIDIDFNSDSSHLLTPVIKCTHAPFDTAVGGQYQLLITVSDNNCLSWSCESPGTHCNGRRFTITARNKPVSETLEEFLAENGTNRFTPELIEIDFDFAFDVNISAFLKKLDGVDRIRNIMAGGCDIDPLFTYMSGATTSDDWGFPKLEGLTIYDCDYEPSTLLSMVEARYGLEEGVGGDPLNGQRDLPPPLKWMTISHVPGEGDKDILGLVEDILGPGCFEFDEDVER